MAVREPRTELGPPLGRDIEIARRPDLSARFERTQSRMEDEDPAVAGEALGELTAVLDEALEPENRIMRRACTRAFARSPARTFMHHSNE
ncbi:hypothetical protein ACFYOV_06340 [Streptomyces sp. NPDC005931]|uniref:hypothetical protein n=1 Tax=Streptomyces sp. NPDC005931 TaxID=3364737 RepID=UPI0036BF63E8